MDQCDKPCNFMSCIFMLCNFHSPVKSIFSATVRFFCARATNEVYAGKYSMQQTQWRLESRYASNATNAKGTQAAQELKRKDGVTMSVKLVFCIQRRNSRNVRKKGIGFHGKPISKLQSVICHMGGITECYVPPYTGECVPWHFNPSQTCWHSIYLPSEGWKAELTLVLAICTEIV